MYAILIIIKRPAQHSGKRALNQRNGCSQWPCSVLKPFGIYIAYENLTKEVLKLEKQREKSKAGIGR